MTIMQVLYALDAQVVHVAVAEPLLAAGCDMYRATLYQHTVPSPPFLAKECYFAIAIEVFYGDKAAGLARLCKFGTHCCDNATKGYLFAILQLTCVGKFSARCVAQVVEHYAILV